MIQFIPYGDSAVLVNFEQKISQEVNSKVAAHTQAIENAGVPGILSIIPAYCSITVIYDSARIKYGILADILKSIFMRNEGSTATRSCRNLLIPVCYAPPYALDIVDLSTKSGISVNEIITAHTSQIFHVFMLGFLPGFPYMGILPDTLICQRKKHPRQCVPAGSVGLASIQTGIYPIDAPGGWQIIGRTPVPVFQQKNHPHFLFAAGDAVQFYPISKSEFIKMETDMVQGQFQIEKLYGQ